MSDEELQRSIESNQNVAGQADAEAYKMVFSVLNREVDYRIAPDFADRLVKMISSEVARKEARRDRIWLTLGICAMTIAFIYVFQTVDFEPGVGVFTFVSSYWGLLLFGAIMIVGLHTIEKYLLRDLHQRE